jgi:chorismate mutase / prephenate dehydratase
MYSLRWKRPYARAEDRVEKEISKIREEIDRIDSELLGLLNRRMELAAGVGRIKASKGIPSFTPSVRRSSSIGFPQ